MLNLSETARNSDKFRRSQAQPVRISKEFGQVQQVQRLTCPNHQGIRTGSEVPALNLSESAKYSDRFRSSRAQPVLISKEFGQVQQVQRSTCPNQQGIRTSSESPALNLSESTRYSDKFSRSHAQPVRIIKVFGQVQQVPCSTCPNHQGIRTSSESPALNLSESSRNSDKFSRSHAQPVRISKEFGQVQKVRRSTCPNQQGIRTSSEGPMLNLSESSRYSDKFSRSHAQPVRIIKEFGQVQQIQRSTCPNHQGIRTSSESPALNLSESSRNSDKFRRSSAQPVRINKEFRLVQKPILNLLE